MSLQPGLYKVTFKTQIGEGIGVVYLEGGKLRGGDAVYAWVGSYEEPDSSFEARLNIFQHTTSEASASVFGVENAEVRLKGKPQGPDFKVEGFSAAAPDVSFEARLERVID